MLPAACRRRTLSRSRLEPVSYPAACHGVFEVTVPSSAWALAHETGKYHFTARVAFEEPFHGAPRVVAGLSALELGDGPSSRLEVRIVPDSITATGFTIRFATATSGGVHSAAAFWLAIPS
jgi:hypothetical protein